MEFSRARIIKIAVMLVFLSCMLFANFFAVRLMFRYGEELYFYDKFLVAYTVGREEGLKMELDKLPETNKLRRELIKARNSIAKLDTVADPETFLAERVQRSKKMLFLIKNLRTAAFLIIVILFGWRLIAARRHKEKK